MTGRHERRAQRARRRAASHGASADRGVRERLLGGRAATARGRDEADHVLRDAHRGDLRGLRIAFDLVEVARVRRLQVEHTPTVDHADAVAAGVGEGDEPHAATPAPRTPSVVSASISAGRSLAGKSGSGRRTGPQRDAHHRERLLGRRDVAGVVLEEPVQRLQQPVLLECAGVVARLRRS